MVYILLCSLYMSFVLAKITVNWGSNPKPYSLFLMSCVGLWLLALLGILRHYEF